MVDFLDKHLGKKGERHYDHHRHHKKFYITCKSDNIDKKKLTGDLHCKVVFYGKNKKKMGKKEKRESSSSTSSKSKSNSNSKSKSNSVSKSE